VRGMDEYFEISARGSTVRREIVAGLTSFVAISYILVVNAKILAPVFEGDVNVVGPKDARSQVIPTAIPSGLTSILLGILSRKPIIAAPGLGLSSYITYSLVLANVLTTTEAFTACLLSGVICTVSAMSGLSNGALSRLVPSDVKKGIIVGMGLLIAMIGLSSSHVISKSDQPDVIIELTKTFTPEVVLALFGILFVATMLQFQIQGGLLVGMLVTTAFSWFLLHSQPPTSLFSFPMIHFESLGKVIDLTSFSMKMIPAIISFTAVSIFDVGGVMYGFNNMLEVDGSDDNTPVFVGTSIGTIISSLFGGSPIIVAIEGAAGISSGGKTGLTSVICGICFFLSIFLSPVLVAIPSAATGPVLVCIGGLMIGEIRTIDFDRFEKFFPSFLTMIAMPFTYSISNGIWAGFIGASYFAVTEKARSMLQKRGKYVAIIDEDGP